MELFTNQEVFNFFLNSGVHGKRWPSDVFCVVEVESNAGRVITLVETNGDGFDAEENMINRLRDMMIDDTLSSQTMTWFLNYSPCSKCSGAIVSFLNEAEEIYGVEIDLTIHFAALYKIRRRSCESGQHSHSHRLPSYKEHSRNVKGLSRLQEFGVGLFTFDEGEWQSLADLLGVVFRGSGVREMEDDQLREDFGDVMSNDISEDGDSDSSEEGESDEGDSTEDDDDGDEDYEESDDEDDDNDEDSNYDGDESEVSEDDGDEETDDEEDGDDDYDNDENSEEYEDSDDTGDEDADDDSDDEEDYD